MRKDEDMKNDTSPHKPTHNQSGNAIKPLVISLACFLPVHSPACRGPIDG